MDRLTRGLLLSALLAGAAPAFAEDLIPSEDVKDRAHAEYDPRGVRLGSFILSPSLTATGAATDNYRATHKVRQANVGLLLKPDLAWRSDWLRNAVDGNVYVQQTVNTPLKKENSFTYGGRVSGMLEPSRDSEIRLTLTAKRDAEDRRYIGSALGTIGPNYFSILQGDASATKMFGQLKGTIFGSAQQARFDDVTLPNGVRIGQDYRDYRNLEAGASATYELSNGIGLELSGRHSDIHYLFGPGDPGYIPGLTLDRDAISNTVTLGVTLELSSLIYGTIRVGHLHRDVADPRVHDLSGLTYEANILWNVTPLTSLLLNARRTVDPATTIQSAGIVRSEASIEVHHELYRSLLLTAQLRAIRFRSINDPNDGEEYHARMGARYKLNRSISIIGSADYSRRNAAVVFNIYHAVEGTVGIRYAM
jgi:hypothetical protein